jgi:pimeloyl-ACP methyl ester carboxylesterase
VIFAAVTYLLVHGGGTTSRFWDRLLPHLDGPALAVDLPGRAGNPADLATITVDDEVASVLRDAAALPDGAVTVVAHSSGGLVVPGVVAAMRDRVERIVLSAALVPPEGGCGLDCMQPRHAEGLRMAMDAARQAGDVITLPAPTDPEQMRKAYGGEPLDDALLAFVADPVRAVADTVFHYFQPVRWSTIAGLPVTYVANTLDRPIPYPLQQEMIGRLPDPPVVVELESGHAPAVTMPEEFAKVLVNAH